LAGLLAVAVGYLVWEGRKPADLPSAVSTPASQVVGVPVNPATEAPAQPNAPARPATAGNQTEPCPVRLSINRELPTPFTCLCSAQAIQEGPVWGTDIYTGDSGLCRAALHAGVIPAGGGEVTVLRGAGRLLYIGSSRNGIRSSDYGAYIDSIRFVGTALPAAGPEPCPVRLSINRELPTPFTCMCDAQAMQEDPVWGTDIYTDDSGLCRAAVHAGAIPAAGGLVTVERTAGRQLYTGSSRNGIRSSDYGAYSDSIRFQAR
jgi:hypothetical protein